MPRSSKKSSIARLTVISGVKAYPFVITDSFKTLKMFKDNSESVDFKTIRSCADDLSQFKHSVNEE